LKGGGKKDEDRDGKHVKKLKSTRTNHREKERTVRRGQTEVRTPEKVYDPTKRTGLESGVAQFWCVFVRARGHRFSAPSKGKVWGKRISFKGAFRLNDAPRSEYRIGILFHRLYFCGKGPREGINKKKNENQPNKELCAHNGAFSAGAMRTRRFEEDEKTKRGEKEYKSLGEKRQNSRHIREMEGWGWLLGIPLRRKKEVRLGG